MTNTRTEHERDLALEDFAALTEAVYLVVLRQRPKCSLVGFGVERLEGPGPNDPGDDRRKPDPAFAEVSWILLRLALQNRSGITDRNRIVLPTVLASFTALTNCLGVIVGPDGMSSRSRPVA